MDSGNADLLILFVLLTLLAFIWPMPTRSNFRERDDAHDLFLDVEQDEEVA